MGYIVRPNDIVKSSSHTYRILKEINKGGFADAFKAIDETGKAVFFKQYKSPTKLVPWFDKYFDYEKELNSRLKTAKNTLREEKRELRKCLKTIKHNIRLEKRAIKKNKHEKFSINRSLSKKFRYATKVNKAFSNDHVVQQKAR